MVLPAIFSMRVVREKSLNDSPGHDLLCGDRGFGVCASLACVLPGLPVPPVPLTVEASPLY